MDDIKNLRSLNNTIHTRSIITRIGMILHFLISSHLFSLGPTLCDLPQKRKVASSLIINYLSLLWAQIVHEQTELTLRGQLKFALGTSCPITGVYLSIACAIGQRIIRARFVTVIGLIPDQQSCLPLLNALFTCRSYPDLTRASYESGDFM